MNFPGLVADLKRFPCEENRKESDGYFEIVVKSADAANVALVLSKYLGPPFKPAGIVPDKTALKYSNPYGGIQKHQTLFYLADEGLSNCAMLWPWSDGTRVTLKAAQGTVLGA